MDGSVPYYTKPAYRLEWAYKIVDAFIDCYPRATEIVFKEFHFDRPMAAFCLANRESSWENFKKVVQLTDRYLGAQRISGQLEIPEAIASAVRSYATKHLLCRNRNILTKKAPGAPL